MRMDMLNLGRVPLSLTKAAQVLAMFHQAYLLRVVPAGSLRCSIPAFRVGLCFLHHDENMPVFEPHLQPPNARPAPGHPDERTQPGSGAPSVVLPAHPGRFIRPVLEANPETQGLYSPTANMYLVCSAVHSLAGEVVEGMWRISQYHDDYRLGLSLLCRVTFHPRGLREQERGSAPSSTKRKRNASSESSDDPDPKRKSLRL